MPRRDNRVFVVVFMKTCLAIPSRNTPRDTAKIAHMNAQTLIELETSALAPNPYAARACKTRKVNTLSAPKLHADINVIPNNTAHCLSSLAPFRLHPARLPQFPPPASGTPTNSSSYLQLLPENSPSPYYPVVQSNPLVLRTHPPSLSLQSETHSPPPPPPPAVYVSDRQASSL